MHKFILVSPSGLSSNLFLSADPLVPPRGVLWIPFLRVLIPSVKLFIRIFSRILVLNNMFASELSNIGSREYCSTRIALLQSITSTKNRNSSTSGIQYQPEKNKGKGTLDLHAFINILKEDVSKSLAVKSNHAQTKISFPASSGHGMLSFRRIDAVLIQHQETFPHPHWVFSSCLVVLLHPLRVLAYARSRRKT